MSDSKSTTIRGKSYEFNTPITLGIFVQAKKLIRKVDEGLLPLLSGEELTDEKIDENVALIRKAWPELCAVIFKSVPDVEPTIEEMRAVTTDFFGAAVGIQKKSAAV